MESMMSLIAFPRSRTWKFVQPQGKSGETDVDFFSLNMNGKTEFILTGTKRQLEKANIDFVILT